MKSFFWLFLIYCWLSIEISRLIFLRVKGKELKDSKVVNFLNEKFLKAHRDYLVNKFITSYLKDKQI